MTAPQHAPASNGANLVAEIFTEVRIEALERRIIGAGRFRRSGERGSAGGNARYSQSGATAVLGALPDRCNRLVLRTLIAAVVSNDLVSWNEFCRRWKRRSRFQRDVIALAAKKASGVKPIDAHLVGPGLTLGSQCETNWRALVSASR
jgi:hypothetical protein